MMPVQGFSRSAQNLAKSQPSVKAVATYEQQVCRDLNGKLKSILKSNIYDMEDKHFFRMLTTDLKASVKEHSKDVKPSTAEAVEQFIKHTFNFKNNSGLTAVAKAMPVVDFLKISENNEFAAMVTQNITKAMRSMFKL